jgi:hypothetical protein
VPTFTIIIPGSSAPWLLVPAGHLHSSAHQLLLLLLLLQLWLLHITNGHTAAARVINHRQRILYKDSKVQEM